jgi:hypothetical protein
MRRYNIVSGILLILSIIHFALAAPLSVQEKRQERVDVVHIPKDVITVLGRRWGEDLEKLLEEYLEGEKPAESAPPGPENMSKNVVQPPAPNPAASTANPDPLREPTRCSWIRGNCLGVPWRDLLWMDDDSSELHRPLYDVTPPGSSSEHELSWWVKPVQQGIQTVQDWVEKANRWAQKLKVINPDVGPWIDPSPGSDFDWYHWINAEDPPLSLASPPKELGQAHKYQVDPTNPPSTSGYAPSPPLAEPEHEAVTPSPLSPNLRLEPLKEPEDPVLPGKPTSPDPEIPLDPLSSNADSQPVDLQAAIYAAKGKAKESRHISGTARDTGNAAERDLHHAERSLKEGEYSKSRSRPSLFCQPTRVTNI